jgi:hypothetical protein
MLSPNWIAFCVTIYIVGMILGMTMSGGDPFGASQTVTNGMSNPTMSINWLSSLWGICTLDFTFFHAYNNQLEILRYIILTPITVTLAFSLIVLLFNYIRGL